MWLTSDAPADPEDDTVIDKHGEDTQNNAVKMMMHAIQIEDEEAQHDAVHQMIQIPHHRTIGSWAESKLANGKPLFQILMEIVDNIHFEWTEDKQTKLEALVE